MWTFYIELLSGVASATDAPAIEHLVALHARYQRAVDDVDERGDTIEFRQALKCYVS